MPYGALPRCEKILRDEGYAASLNFNFICCMNPLNEDNQMGAKET